MLSTPSANSPGTFWGCLYQRTCWVSWRVLGTWSMPRCTSLSMPVYPPLSMPIYPPLSTTEHVHIPITEHAYITITKHAHIPITEHAHIPITDYAHIPTTEHAYIPITDYAYIPITEHVYIDITEHAYIPITEHAHIPITSLCGFSDIIAVTIDIDDHWTEFIEITNFRKVSLVKNTANSLKYWCMHLLDVFLIIWVPYTYFKTYHI